MNRLLLTLALLLLFIFPAHAEEMDWREVALAQEELRQAGYRRVWIIRGAITNQGDKIIRRLEVWTPLNCVQEIVQELEVEEP